MQLGKWEASINDYEILLGEGPNDEEVGEALAKARMASLKYSGRN